jgi:hypothetical protein
MHDAMQTYWSRFANSAQWSLWVFFASLHETGNSLGGVMFDDIGPNHRQGTSVFEDAFIANAPAGDANPVAWVRRMRFWTAVHEMGHSFNLAHSWQKALGPPTYPPPWLPGLANEPEARSFMNYPYNVAGGQSAFFSDFPFRFSDSELLFMRHAPAQWVQQGNADWFDHHGFQAPDSAGAGLRLVVRCNREKAAYDFLEPVTLEVKLTNTSTEPKVVPANALATDQLTIVIKKQGRAARQLAPFAQYCHQPQMRTLNPGESMYESLYASSGVNGWDLAEPGDYVVQVAAHLADEQAVAAPMTLRMKPPQNFDEEHVAQDFFSEDVGRILAFDGSRYLESGNNTLRDVCERMPNHRVAVHAHVALGRSLGRAFKQLKLGDGRDPMRGAGDAGGKITAAKANVESARKELNGALFKKADAAAETLGHVDYNYYATEFAKWLVQYGEGGEAAAVCVDLRKTLSARNVLKSVLDAIPTPSAGPIPKKKSAKAGK